MDEDLAKGVVAVIFDAHLLKNVLESSHVVLSSHHDVVS